MCEAAGYRCGRRGPVSHCSPVQVIAPEDRIPQGRSRVGRKPSIVGSRPGGVAWPIPPGGLSGPAGPWVRYRGCVACSMAIWLRRRLAADAQEYPNCSKCSPRPLPLRPELLGAAGLGPVVPAGDEAVALGDEIDAHSNTSIG